MDGGGRVAPGAATEKSVVKILPGSVILYMECTGSSAMDGKLI